VTGVRREVSNFGTQCVDANVVLRLLNAPEHPAVAELWSEFVAADVEIVAPTLLTYELANALHQQWRLGRLGAERAGDLLDVAQALPIALHGDPHLHARALELAAAHNLPAAYNAHYVALAERFRVPLWICDRRLAKEMGQGPPEVHLVP
jgi:predicted nucleic acid-binding protein